MPRELILHIGTSKTGSTSIQHILDANRKALLADGVCYPQTPGSKSHLLLATAFTSFPNMLKDVNNALWLGQKPETTIAAHLDALAAEVGALPASVDRVILSCEQFSMYQRTEKEVQLLHDYVHRLADRCTVVVYLRRQDEHFASLYSQFLRLGHLRAPDLNHLHGFHQDYDYAAFMSRWANVFGKDRVIPRVFERGADKSFDVMEDFAALCRIDLSRLTAGRDVPRNQSMNAAGQTALRQLGLLLQAKLDTPNIAGLVLWHRLSEALTDTAPGKGWLPTRAQAKAFMENYAASNEEVRATWFADRPALFRPDYSNLPKEAKAAPAEAVQTATNGAFLAAMQQSLRREINLHLEKAKLAQRLGDEKLRRAALSHAVRLDARDVTARLQFAECLMDQGELKIARQHLDIADTLAPDAPGVAVMRRKLSAVDKVMPK